MPLPSIYGASVPLLRNSSPLSVYRLTSRRTTKVSPSINLAAPLSPNLSLTRAPDRVHPPRPRRPSSYHGEHTHVRQVVGHERVSSMERVERSGLHGVSSRYGVRPMRRPGRYVHSPPFFFLFTPLISMLAHLSLTRWFPHSLRLSVTAVFPNPAGRRQNFLCRRRRNGSCVLPPQSAPIIIVVAVHQHRCDHRDTLSQPRPGPSSSAHLA